MRFDSIHARGLGVFEDVEIDISSIDGRIVAVAGENGAGKSTLLELLGAALYRQCPTRGSLGALATQRDATLDVRVTTDAEYTLRHTVDAVSGKGEAVVLDAGGAPLTSSGKLREFDAWIARHMPPSAVLYSGQIAVQGEGGFVDLKPGERKAVLLRALGLERLEHMAEAARKRARRCMTEVDVLDARLADLGGHASAKDMSARVIAAQAEADAADAVLTAARVALADAEQAMRAVEAERADVEAQAEARSKTQRSLHAERRAVAELEERLGNNRMVLERAEEIHAAEREAADLDARIPPAADALMGIERRLGAVREDLVRTIEARHPIHAGMERLRTQIATDEATAGQRADVEHAGREMIAAANALVDAQAGEAEAKALAMRLRQTCMSDASGRIGYLRDGLSSVVEATDYAEARRAAKVALDGDDAQVAAAADSRFSLDALVSGDDARASAVHEADSRCTTWRQTAALMPSVKSAEARLLDARHALQSLERQESERLASLVTIEAQKADVSEEHSRAIDVLESMRSVRRSLNSALKRSHVLAGAEARVAELQPSLAATQARADALAAEIAAMPAPREDDLEAESLRQRRVAEGRRVDVGRAETTTRGAHAAAAVAMADAERAAEAQGKADALAADRDLAMRAHSDWTRLGQDLGRDGIQALEIDAAGPELTDLANELLHECVGARFSVSIQTTRSSSDGKRQLEGCEVVVLDTQGGREAAVGSYSGGERVLIGEAVALALTVLSCRRSGVQRPTLIRDETGAALDEGRARAYLAMLRRAADMVDADRVLFVSHSRELQELADATIHLSNGAVAS